MLEVSRIAYHYRVLMAIQSKGNSNALLQPALTILFFGNLQEKRNDPRKYGLHYKSGSFKFHTHHPKW